MSESFSFRCASAIKNNGKSHIVADEKYSVLVADEKYSVLAKRTLSENFMKARRGSALKWEGTAPSFHEIRSLSARLYT
ncbi:MAG: hypothetical protein ACR5LF_16160 [Symbiopectobacterium sp.]